MENPNSNLSKSSAEPGAARDPGQLSHLAKVVDKLTLVRKRMEMLLEQGVGSNSVESEARRWNQQEKRACENNQDSYVLEGATNADSRPWKAEKGKNKFGRKSKGKKDMSKANWDRS